jgi:hypothetical protein
MRFPRRSLDVLLKHAISVVKGVLRGKSRSEMRSMGHIIRIVLRTGGKLFMQDISDRVQRCGLIRKNLPLAQLTRRTGRPAM